MDLAVDHGVFKGARSVEESPKRHEAVSVDMRSVCCVAGVGAKLPGLAPVSRLNWRRRRRLGAHQLQVAVGGVWEGRFVRCLDRFQTMGAQ